MIDLKSLDDNGLVEWARNFSDKIKEYASTFGLSTSDVHRVDEDSQTTTTLVDTTKQAKETRAAPSLQDELAGFKTQVINGPSDQLHKAFPAVFTGLGTMAGVGLLPRILDFIQKLQKNPQMTADMAKSLGIDSMMMQKLKGSDNEMLAWLGNFVEKLKLHHEDISACMSHKCRR